MGYYETKEELERAERLERQWDAHLGPYVGEAIGAADRAWDALAEEAKQFGIEVERPTSETNTRIGHFNALKWSALEISDSIHYALPEAERLKDQQDLEALDKSFYAEDGYSRRVQALAMLNLGKILISTGAEGFVPTCTCADCAAPTESLAS